MANKNALVIYKGKPAIVNDRADGKITISLQSNEQIKVRDKDIELIHSGPVKSFDEIKIEIKKDAIKEVWELLADEGAPLSLKDFAALICGDYTPASAYAAYLELQERLYFSGTIAAITPRSADEVEAETKKRAEKLRESGDRAQFIQQLKNFIKNPSGKFLLDDASSPGAQNQSLHFFQDIEALAYGKSAKSRTMKELRLSETPEAAHSLLLKTGAWTTAINPHPSRYGLTLNSANVSPNAPKEEQRRDLCHLEAFAIDSPWSSDPDDALSIETGQTGETFLYVHVADPAASITHDSPEEKEARDRGSTLYLPEGAVRMLAEGAIQLFALGLSEKSPALTFKLTIDSDGNVTDTEIFSSTVKVRRITYQEADTEINNGQNSLRALYELSQKIFSRRLKHGAVNIDLPDIHITVNGGNVEVEPLVNYLSVSLVRECMIAAGEGAGSWAAAKNIPFPYISQEIEILPANAAAKMQDGLAGSYQLRRCMRPRTLSTKPGIHQGLGLNVYSQVTSPLRRYTDFLAHLQIRAFLRSEPPLTTDEVSARLGASEAAAIAAVQAERASNNHWLMVYLSDKKDSVWEAVALENKGNRMQVIIPALALETQVSLQKDILPNEQIKLVLKSVNIPKGEASFI